MGEILEKKSILKTGRLEVISAKAKLDNGNLVNFSYAKFPMTVSIVPVDKNNNVYLTKEWRLAWERHIIQIPAGVCENKEEENNPEIRAAKELVEEVGMKAKTLEKLATTAVSANSNGIHHIFLAIELDKTEKKPEENEIIEVIKMPINKAFKMFLDGELTTAYTLLGLKLAKEKLNI
ncbi:MAG: NUDIX hydrolase [Candidatus Aenigmarchaeota archaeon]|nr:NUDIX hydrolase [Candidatus Aenigmarchaeota archaeon]